MWILFVMTIMSGGNSSVDKVPAASVEACQNQAAYLNERILPGARYYAFCYDATR